MQSESIACLMRAVSPVEHLAWFIEFSIITSYVSVFVSCSLVNGQDNLSIKSWGLFCSFFPQKLPRFFFPLFCRQMYRRSWEMQGNFLKKHKPSIKWVTFQAGLSLIHSGGSAFDRGTTLCVLCRLAVLSKNLEWLGETGGAIAMVWYCIFRHRQICHVYKCPSWPLLLPWWNFMLLSRQKLPEIIIKE